MTTFIQFRLFIGPRAIGDYDWSAHDSGAADNLTFNTTLAAALASGATSCTLASGLSFPTGGGGLWIGPAASGEGWEYVDYAARSGTSVTGLARENSTYREHNGAHGAGAKVYFWFPLASNNGVLRITDMLTPNMCVRYWRAEIGGFNVTQALMRNDHVAIVQARTTHNGTWTNLLVGFTDSSKMRDDYRRYGEWTIYINSVHGLLEKSEAKGVTLGDMNIAKSGKAYSSAPLGSAYKERYSGEYIASDPTFAPKNAITEGDDVMWIADRTVGTKPTIDDPGTGYFGVTQMYLKPHPGRGPVYKWIELTNYSTGSSYLCLYDPATDTEIQLDFENVDPGEDYRVILTNDPYTFAQENPAHQAHVVVDLTKVGLGSQFLDYCKPEGGCIAIKDWLGDYHQNIIWGNATDYPDGSTPSGVDWDYPGEPSYICPAPDYGQTLYWNWANSRLEVTDQSWPGYLPNEDGDDAWLAVVLPGLGLYLRDDVTPSGSPLAYPSELYLVDAAGDPNTNGLPSSGAIWVGDDYIAYSGKDSEKLTGVGGISSDHSAGDKVLVHDSSGLACDAHALKSVTVYYPGSNYPKKMFMRFSRVLARFPEQSEHENDYNGSVYGDTLWIPEAQAAANPTTYTFWQPEGYRVKTLLLEFRQMSVDPSRPRVSFIECKLHPSYYDPDLWLDDGETAGELVERIALNCEIPAGAIVVDGGTAAITGITTANGPAWETIVDFAEYAGLRIDIGLDSKIRVQPDSLWLTSVGGYVAAKTWTRATASAVEKIFSKGNIVGQVRLEWRNPDGSETGKAYYPSTSSRGLTVEEGPLVFSTSAAAELAARKRYFVGRYPFTILLEAAQGDLTAVPGAVHGLQWQFDSEHGALDRLYLLTSVDHEISAQNITTVLNGIQIDREVDF